MRVAGRTFDLVPPAEADKAPAGDIFEVVKVGGEEENGDYEDKDAEIWLA